MTILQAIRRDLSYSEELQSQLIESAETMGFDLTAQYPDNLSLIDSETLLNEEEIAVLEDGNEYLEDEVGCKYYLQYSVQYSIPNPEYKKQVLAELAASMDEAMSLREYVEYSEENDPNFFRFMFAGFGDQPDWNDWALPEEAKQAYNEFLQSI